jgi:hypothetical protein
MYGSSKQDKKNFFQYKNSITERKKPCQIKLTKTLGKKNVNLKKHLHKEEGNAIISIIAVFSGRRTPQKQTQDCGRLL